MAPEEVTDDAVVLAELRKLKRQTDRLFVVMVAITVVALVVWAWLG
jgi:hypothetical protein